MPQEKIYKNWKAVTEADFVSLFIKTWILRSELSLLYGRFLISTPKTKHLKLLMKWDVRETHMS